MNAAYPLTVTLFWLVYVPVLLLAAGFFAWTLSRYLRSRVNADVPKKKKLTPVSAGDIVAELIALHAQSVVAPKQARREAIALLTQRGSIADEANARLPDDFSSLLELLSRSRPSLPTRPR
jgi:hypothetical protein